MDSRNNEKSNVAEEVSLLMASNGIENAGKASRKRSRAARKTPTTVLNTDTSNFKAMVQHFTGIPPNLTNSFSSSYSSKGSERYFMPTNSNMPLEPFFRSSIIPQANSQQPHEFYYQPSAAAASSFMVTSRSSWDMNSHNNSDQNSARLWDEILGFEFPPPSLSAQTQ